MTKAVFPYFHQSCASRKDNWRWMIIGIAAWIPCAELFLRGPALFPFLGSMRSVHSPAMSPPGMVTLPPDGIGPGLVMEAPLWLFLLPREYPFCRLPFRTPTFCSLSWSRITVYSRRAPNTKMMQAITQHSMAVSPSALTCYLWVWEYGDYFVIHGKFVRTALLLLVWHCLYLYLGTVCLYRVVNVDQDEENCHQQRHPARDNFGVHEKTENWRGLKWNETGGPLREDHKWLCDTIQNRDKINWNLEDSLETQKKNSIRIFSQGR